jgi:heme-degrading monooxygenase HmoA
MFAVVFEVEPKPDRFDDYLSLAAKLKPRLEKIDGFIDVERFKSKRSDRRILSLSIWRDEKSMVRWRTEEVHSGVQRQGHFEIFTDYRLRVGEITSDSSPPSNLPIQQQRFDETEIGDAKALTLTTLTPFATDADLTPADLGLQTATAGLVDMEAYESIYNPGKIVLIAAWRTAGDAASWQPPKPESAATLRHRCVRVIRDYGKFERREAPQYLSQR